MATQVLNEEDHHLGTMASQSLGEQLKAQGQQRPENNRNYMQGIQSFSNFIEVTKFLLINPHLTHLVLLSNLGV